MPAGSQGCTLPLARLAQAMGGLATEAPGGAGKCGGGGKRHLRPRARGRRIWGCAWRRGGTEKGCLVWDPSIRLRE